MILDNNWGVKMGGVYLLIATFFILAVILVTVVLVVLKKYEQNKFEKQVENLDKEKNLIASTPVYTELSKVESMVKNEKMEEKYKNWQKRFDIIKNEKINAINDMINELDMDANMKNYKEFDNKIAKVEMEVYKVRESANKLLDEIKEITVSDEKYRSIITKLKSKYRMLMKEFTTHKEDYEDIADTISLQFETIEKRFLDFETGMENNLYDEVNHIVKALDTMIDHMGVVIVEVPNLVLLSKKLIPKRIEEIEASFKEMTEEKYNLEYLNIPYNMEECNKNVSTIMDKIKVLNLDDCMFELKTLLDYLDSIIDSLEKEKTAKNEYNEEINSLTIKLKKNQKVVKDIYKQIDNIKNQYDLDERELKELENINLHLGSIKKEYTDLLEQESNVTTPYTELVKKAKEISAKLIELENHLNDSLESIGSMQDDETRAREQFEEISDLLKQCKLTVRNFKLPIIFSNYYVELQEANDAIEEIAKELNKKPIVIDILNTRVDTARDLVLKLYKTATEMVKTAELAEKAIVYGNRYRSTRRDVDRNLENAEMLFHKGNYKESLKKAINALELVDSEISNKLLSIYGGNL